MATTIGSLDLASLKNLRDDVTQYFWFESDSSSAWGSGAHVTLYPESQFTDSTSPNYMKGQNIIMNTDGFSIRNGGLPMMVLDNDSLDFNLVDTTAGTYTTTATFTATGAQIGQTGGAHSVIDANGQRFYNGTTQLANIGYGIGTSQSGTAIAPYYTFGVRKTTTTAYSSSSTYAVGDMCVYDEKVYACCNAIITPREWNRNDWRLAIGNYSVAEGMETTASGYYSHAEGIGTVAVGYFSHAEGNMTIAGFGSAHAEGEETKALGVGAHSEGYLTIASGYNAHAQGEGTIANRLASTAIGLYNIPDIDGNNYTRGNYALIIGNGTADDARSNALTVDWSGNVEAAGGVIVNKTDNAKNLAYTGEYVAINANQTASTTAGQLTLTTAYQNVLLANKYNVGTSPLGDELYSVSNGVVTLLKAGRYKLHGQVYLYNGFTANDQVTACILYNGNSSNLRGARTRAITASPYITLQIETYVVADANGTLQLVALNDTAARGKIGLSLYTHMFVECLGVYE